MNTEELIKDFCRPNIGDKVKIKSNNEKKIVSEIEFVDDTFIIYTEDGFSYAEHQLINLRVVSLISDLLYIPTPEEISSKYGVTFYKFEKTSKKKTQKSYYLFDKIRELWIKLKKSIT